MKAVMRNRGRGGVGFSTSASSVSVLSSSSSSSSRWSSNGSGRRGLVATVKEARERRTSERGREVCGRATAEEVESASSARKFNFSAGPAMLPLDVLEEVQRDLVSYKGSGMSVLEMSHRSKEFIAIADGAEESLRELMGIPDTYEVLFMQGGASTEFSAIPLNLTTSADDVADYVTTGSWSKKYVFNLVLCHKHTTILNEMQFTLRCLLFSHQCIHV